MHSCFFSNSRNFINLKLKRCEKCHNYLLMNPNNERNPVLQELDGSPEGFKMIGETMQ